MSLTTLPLAFFKHCIRRPTYLDVLPGDVLRFCITPFLGWDDRIHLNMLTPPGDRTPPNKIPKNRIIGHQMKISAIALRKDVDVTYKIASGKQPIHSNVDAIIRAMRNSCKGHTILLCQHHAVFRRTVEDRIAFFSSEAEIQKIPCIAQRQAMRECLDEVLQKLVAHPLKEHVNAAKWLSERVTQNELALFRLAPAEGPGYIARNTGTIYSMME